MEFLLFYTLPIIIYEGLRDVEGLRGLRGLRDVERGD